ncbi:MAG: RHS repeat-associated core domain-containing protein [Bacteroidia bacterium]
MMEFTLSDRRRGARWYDPAAGRWWGVDALAGKRPSLSSYNYVQNNPMLRIDPDGKLDGDIYNLNGQHIGNDGLPDQRVYLYHTTSNQELTQEQSFAMTDEFNTNCQPSACIESTELTEVPITNDELNLRASLSTLKQAEAGSKNPPLQYNSWNHGDNFTEDSYATNPSAYSSHPGTNTPHGSASGAYQFLSKFYNEPDFSPQSQDRAAVKNMTTDSYKAALSGNMVTFKETTSARWVSLNHWSSENLQAVFNKYRANELTGRSNIATPIGTLLRKK